MDSTVTITFQGPDFTEPPRHTEGNPHWAEGFSTTVLHFDLDYGALTVVPEGADGTNLVLARRTERFQNEDGQEIGRESVCWKIDPEDELLAALPEIARYAGLKFGRVLVTCDAEQQAPFMPLSLREQVRDALEGDSNDEEHSTLARVADHYGVEYVPNGGEITKADLARAIRCNEGRTLSPAETRRILHLIDRVEST